jgi:CubicO group peptidase (beta-lactamase class C family)
VLIRLFAAVLFAVPAVPPVPARAAVVDAAAIDAVVRAYRDATRIPGVAVAVVRGRDVVHTAGYGHTADGDAVTDRTVLPVASLSKSITALAVLQLVEAGRVRLDAPVRDQLPEFTMADDRAAAITVRQLLDQTSGMSDTTYRSVSGPALHTLEQAVASMRGARLAADPGARFDYHNPNYQVAARLVEVVSGLSFDAYLRQRVFGPLGMTGSRTIGTADELPSGSRGHRMIAGLAVALTEPPAFGNGSGGVLSTAHDMSAWLIAQNDRGRGPDGRSVVSPAAITAMHRPSARGPYGLGWNVGATESGAPLVDHTGGLITITAYQALLPASGYGIAVIANAGSQYGDAPGLGARLIDLVENRPVSAPTGSAPLIGIDVALLLSTLGAAGLSIRGVRHARRWARRHRLGRPATVARLLPYLLPLVLLTTLHRVVSALYRGLDISWIQAAYLYPACTVLLLVATPGCAAVLGARLVRSQIPDRCGTEQSPPVAGLTG